MKENFCYAIPLPPIEAGDPWLNMLERHRIDISENLFDAKNYDIIIHCNGKSKVELAEQFFGKLETYFVKENLP